MLEIPPDSREIEVTDLALMDQARGSVLECWDPWNWFWKLLGQFPECAMFPNFAPAWLLSLWHIEILKLEV
jgi:hypothetical protein